MKANQHDKKSFMNLIKDPWIPAIRQDGIECKIAPWQIVEIENPIIELTAPRPDFQGALYQFLIGLLQTTFAPEDQVEWLKYWENVPDAQKLKSTFELFSEAFELANPEGPAFMQDFSLTEGKKKPIAALLIESPGSKTIKSNLDHFVKGGLVPGACESCSASALFTLQINAPSGGAGHRVGLRGGGPLTTLVKRGKSTRLWQQLWANLLTEEASVESIKTVDSSVLPWMAESRYSTQGETTYPDDVNPLQAYWSMPRRIRLLINEVEEGCCSLCGTNTNRLASSFITKNYGINYDGPWVHPLTPYRFDLKKENFPLSLKGQKGGLTYRHWLGLAWLDEASGDTAAQVVREFNTERVDLLLDDQQPTIWCFGYDMDNMKARCWYEHQMPLIDVSKSIRDVFVAAANQLNNAAREAAKLLRSQIKTAWFSRPADVKGDMMTMDQAFWQVTEPDFFQMLHHLSKMDDGSRQMPPQVADRWRNILRKSTLSLFDQWVLEGDAEDLDMKRITKARRELVKKLNIAKPFKDLEQLAETTTESA